MTSTERETRRLAALRATHLLDTPADPAYDAFATLVAQLCDVPVAFVSLVDESRQWFKASLGLAGLTQTPRDIAFCAHAIECDDVLEVPDTWLDPRFAINPLVVGPPYFRFYAGMPLADRHGNVLGTLCAMDVRPRRLTAEQRTTLRALATSLVSLIESRASQTPAELDRMAVVNGAIEHMAEALAILDFPQTGERPTIGYVNRAFADLFEFAAADLIGKDPAVLYGPQTDLAKIARLRADVRDGKYGNETVVLHTATGALRSIELRDRPIDARRRIVTCHDLTSVHATQKALELSNHRLQSLLANNSDALLTFDADGSCSDANAVALAAFACERGDLTGFGYLAFNDRRFSCEGELFPATMRDGRTMRYDATFRNRDGAVTTFDCKVVPMIVHGRSEGAYLIARDVTEARRADARSAEQARRTRALYRIAARMERGTGNPIDDAMQLVLEGFDMQFGYVGERVGDHFHIRNAVGEIVIAAGSSLPLDRTYVRQTLEFGDVIAIEDMSDPQRRLPGLPQYPGWHGYISMPLVVGERQYGALGFLSRSKVAFDGLDCDFVRLVASLVSSELERQAQRAGLDRLAFTDLLTGMPNRARFVRDLDAAIEEGATRARRFALHFIDLDGFKAVNDRYGHAIGDLALVQAARRLRLVLREPDDSPARLGGDEFVVIQRIDDLAQARALGARIVAALGEPCRLEGIDVALGASVGIAIYPDEGRDAHAMLRAADSALYRAKAAGKNRIDFAAAPHSAHARFAR